MPSSATAVRLLDADLSAPGLLDGDPVRRVDGAPTTAPLGVPRIDDLRLAYLDYLIYED